MNEINEEIKQTINLMQAVNDECVYAAMQKHLDGLLEIKRNELQQRLVERSWLDHADGMGSVVKFDQAPHKSVKLDGQVEDKPLTAEELKAGGWWCADVSEECANALKSKHLRVFNSDDWGEWSSCGLDSKGSATRGYFGEDGGNKQIHRIGNDFYWSEK